MTKKLLLATCLLFASLLALSQRDKQAGLSVTVWDGNRSVAVEGAILVTNTNRKLYYFTNEQGLVRISPVSMQDSIKISAIGYETKLIACKDLLQKGGKIELKPQPLLLQEMTIVSNATNYHQTISKVDVKMRGINNSQEALRIVPGLFIGQHAGGGKAEQIFLRGFDIDHGTDIAISVDGMPVNMVSHAHGQGYADLHFLIPEAVETVQFKKGTYDAAKGNFTTAGFVDFRTKKSLDRSMVKLEGGQFNTFRNVALINLLPAEKREDHSLYLASEWMQTKGYFDHPQNFNRFNVMAKYDGRISSRTMLSLSASTFRSKWNASGQIPDRAVKDGSISFFGAIDPNEGGQTARTNVNTQFFTTLKNNSVLKNQFYYTAYDFTLFSNFTFFLNDSVNGDQIKQKEKRNLLGYNGSYTTTHFSGTKKLTTEFGTNIRFDQTDDSELSRTKNRNTLLEAIQSGDIKELNAAAYASETIQWNQYFSINGSLRLDHFNLYYLDRLNSNQVSKANSTVLSPKLNLYYHVNDKTELYFSTGRGFHSNDTRLIVQSGDKKIAPAAYGTDLGLNFKPAKKIFINAAFWHLLMEQEFVYVGDEGIVEPNGKTKRTGIDVSIRYQPLPRLFIDADFNYSNGRFTGIAKGENYLPLAPRYTSTGGISYKSETGFNGSLRYRYMGDRPANEDNSVIAKGYFVTDAVIAYSKRRYEATVSIQNLFDVRWKETQFETESRLLNEPESVSEIHFTPGTPFFIKAGISVFF